MKSNVTKDYLAKAYGLCEGCYFLIWIKIEVSCKQLKFYSVFGWPLCMEEKATSKP